VNCKPLFHGVLVLLLMYLPCCVLALRAEESTKSGSDSALEPWAAELSAGYDGRTALEKFLARGTTGEGFNQGSKAWQEAFGEDRPLDKHGKLHLTEVLCRHEALWRGDEFQEAVSKRQVARIALLSKDDIQKWQERLAAAHGDGISEIWTIALMVDIDRLFTEDGFNSEESGRLLARLDRTPEEAIAALADTLEGAKGVAAVAIIRNDAFFKKDAFDDKTFQKALALLKEKTAKRKQE
jgi:hypothetical protein